ncbi:MAG: LysR family transcriptional regulator [Solobacterium sp.]|nr:LysR family transcriptional regulator [Solobacterium sp.]
MDFKDLKYMITVAECGSVTAAAKKLYVSQPSLSYVISRVEEDLGVKLFDRRNTPVTLTYAGKRYLEAARQILEIDSDLRKELGDIIKEEAGEIDLGIPTERAGYMLPKVLGKFRSSFPKVNLRLREARSAQIIHDLEAGNIDIAVLPAQPAEISDRFETELICREHLYLIAGRGLITKDMIVEKGNDRQLPMVDLHKMKNVPFILMSEGQYIRRYAEKILSDVNVNPNEMTVVTSGITAVQLAKEGLGATIVSERAVNPLGGIREIPCYRYSGSDAMWDVRAVYRKGAYLSRSARFLIDLLKEEFGHKDDTGQS